MYLEHAQFEAALEYELGRRASVRKDIQCRARVRIGDRFYAGFLQNISTDGAKLRTISRIQKLGRVTLTLPDLPQLMCELRWTDNFNAGVQFALPLPKPVLARWILMRPVVPLTCEAEIEGA